MKKMVAALMLFGMLHVQGDVVIRIGLDGIVQAAKQRGNLFQMLGYYVQLFSHLNYHYPEENLRKHMEEYEAVLNDMEAYFPDTKIQKDLKHSREIWQKLRGDFDALLSKQKYKKPDREAVEKMLARIVSLASDMRHIQSVLTAKSLDPVLMAEISATTEMVESSAKLGTYYIMKVSVDPSMITEAEREDCMQAYQRALTDINKSDLSQAKIFKKRFGALKKVYFFNTMVAQMSKTPIPSLVLKKNYTAYLSALINTQLIVAASTEGKEKTMKMY